VRELLPKVSVIIPTKNRFELLYRAIESVLAQTYQNWELIIVIDSKSQIELQTILNYCRKLDPTCVLSHENTALFKISRTTSVHVMQNKTFSPEGDSLKEIYSAASARNFGIYHSSGRFVAFLDSDDTWSPSKLEIQVNFMRESGLWVSHSDYLLKKAGLPEPEYISTAQMTGRKVSQRIAFRECTIATPTVMYDRLNFSHLTELFPPQLDLNEDTVAWLRLAAYSKENWGHLAKPLTTVYSIRILQGTKSLAKKAWRYCSAKLAICV